MLEAKNLVKIYKPKRGVPVKALDKVSLKFPDKGMVFLLGKSGSGKSTLLNLLGGLDKYNEGDIVIKGVSSKDFKQKHFDSYRNTYVGFIFQEYNVLEEFSVGANIGLALELQGKKATDEEINRILKEVDLEGYGNRKPNELSGGQKQRVAIARALVKNPEIIMADEPTGALDSNTGRQVFDTLKKLSKDKLVIIVSHDREFSENYADRIIELADGKVISDVEYAGELDGSEVVEEIEEPANLKFENNIIEVVEGYHLTEEDRIAINQYIDDLKNGNVVIKLDSKRVSNKKFVDTNQDNIVSQKNNDFKLIKSKLPFKNAIKIGASGLKHKKFRLIVTIILSCISFGLFGLSDTLGSYDHVKTCTNSLVDSNVTYASLVKSVRTGSGINEYYETYGNLMSEADIEEIEKNIGTEFTPVYQPINSSLDLEQNMELNEDIKEGDKIIYSMSLNGFGEISEEAINEYGYKVLAGKMPDGKKNELALSKYMYDSFVKFGYVNNGKKEEIKKPEDLVGKSISIANVEYEIVAIIDTNMDIDRYLAMVEEDEHVTTSEQLANYALLNEFNYCKDYSLAKIAMVGAGHIDELVKRTPDIYEIIKVWIYGYSEEGSFDPYYVTELDRVKDDEIIWIDGEKDELMEKELILPKSMLYDSMGEELDLSDSAVIKKIKNINIELDIWDDSTLESTYEDGYKIVGVLTDSEKYADTFVVCKDLFEKCVSDIDGKYMFAVGNMPSKKADIEDMVAYCYRTDSDIRYELQNPVTYELSIISIVLKLVSKAFFYVGIFFALFAALMLANFIGTSISYKKQEIGILRAIGSRSNDVFRIFFSESFIIAMINFVLSISGVFVVTNAINLLIREELGILVTVLHCGIRQVVLLFVVSVVVAFVASFLPVRKIAAKKPIDAIRKR
ncbi:MAG: ABC transporter ATP-binding protein/permease [Lachnospiraceae bacterium]|nr:ABC transporter ATP-binding protein/permease [Lachnospiraceae bacterium]